MVREGRAPHPDGTEVDRRGLVDAHSRRRRQRPAGSTTWRPSPSAASSTAWSASTSPGRWSATPCCGTTPARPTRPRELIADLGGAVGVGRRGRLGTRRVVHGHQAALARRTTSRNRPRRTARRLPAPRLADLAAARHGRRRRPGDRPGRRQRHRLLVAGDRRLPPRPARARARPRRRAAAGPRAEGGRRPRGRGPLLGAGYRRQRGLRPRPGRRPGRRRRLHRHLRRRLRRLRGARGRPVRDRRRLRRRHRPVPAPGRHAQRGAGARLHRTAARRRPRGPRRPRPGGVLRAPAARCSSRTSRASAPPTGRTPRPRCTASPSAPGRRPPSPGRPWRACCAAWPTRSTPWRHRGRSPRGSCSSAAAPRHARSARSHPPCSAARCTYLRRASTSRGAPPARPPGSWPVRPSRRCGRLPVHDGARGRARPRGAGAVRRGARSRVLDRTT